MNSTHNHLALQTECTLFFEANPYTYETVEGLSVRLGRNGDQLEPILQELVNLSILSKLSRGDRVIYRYNAPDIVHVG